MDFVVVGSYLLEDVVANRFRWVCACSFKCEVKRAVDGSAWIDRKVGFVFVGRTLNKL